MVRQVGNLLLLDGRVPRLVVPAWVDWPWLVHGYSTRLGGTSQSSFSSLNLGLHVGDNEGAVLTNRVAWADALGASEMGEVFMQQVHGDTVTVVEQSGNVNETDGVATAATGVLLNVLVADCQPILLVDPTARVIAAVHAGWRGTVAGIAAAAVRIMVNQLGAKASRIQANLGPSIGGCCYRVDEPVMDKVRLMPFDWRPAVRNTADSNQWLLDITRLNFEWLLQAGLGEKSIIPSELCSLEHDSFFYSYRRDKGRTGRFVGSIGILPEGKSRI